MSKITNLDPKPWIDAHHASRRRFSKQIMVHREGGEEVGRLAYRPRPEFDVGDNPVLVAVAQSLDEDWLRWLAEPESDDGFYVLNGRYEPFTPEQIEHARTVLELIKKEQSA